MSWRMLCDLHLLLCTFSSRSREIDHAGRHRMKQLLQIQTRCMCSMMWSFELYNLAFFAKR